MSERIELNGIAYEQLFPDLLKPLGKDEFEALVTDVYDNGITYPVIVVIADGVHWVVDGWHRLLAALENELPTVEIPVRTYPEDCPDDYLRGRALKLNTVRRHMTAEERQQAVALLRKQGKSQRVIAAELGISVGTVNGDCSGVQHQTPEQTTGADGKTYPARPATEEEIQERRAEVVERQRRGETVREIAAALGVSTGTVSDDLAAVELNGKVADAVRAEEVLRLGPMMGKNGIVLRWKGREVHIGARTVLQIPGDKSVCEYCGKEHKRPVEITAGRLIVVNR